MPTIPKPMQAALFQPTRPGESVARIWDASRITDRAGDRIEMPDLVRFKDHWYCAFREAPIHNAHPLGRCRVIRSTDGSHWDTAAILDWDCGDVREVKLAVTAEGCLMASTAVCFVSREPRRNPGAPPRDKDLTYTPPEARKAHDEADLYYQLDWLGTPLNLVDHDREPFVSTQTVTWVTPDGIHWGSAYADNNCINTWLWGITWHNGMGYSLAQWGKDPHATLYRTRDGKSWRQLTRDCGPDGRCNEGSIAFDHNNTAHCLFRDGDHHVMIGASPGPYYQHWSWQPALIDYGPDHTGPLPAKQQLRVSLGGPKLIRLQDGRLLAAGRALGPGRNDGRVTLFWLDPQKALLTWITEFDGTAYPGVVEHEGLLWVTYISSACHDDRWEVHLAKFRLPH